MPPRQDMIAEAVDQRIRLREASEEDWQAFVQWLEADPERNAAYDSVALADIDFERASLPPARPAAANDAEPIADRRRKRHWRFLGPVGAAAAAAAAVVVVNLPTERPGADAFDISTGAGTHRRIALGDGSFADLNGSSILRLSRGNARSAELVSGEATFNIRHDPARPFDLVAGGHHMRDLGTVFNVLSEPHRFRLEIGNGALLFEPDGAAIQLTAGLALQSLGGGRTIVRRTDPQGVGGWRNGRLRYEGARLAEVVSDLARTCGADIRLHRSLEAMLFTGSVRVDPDHEETLNRLALVLNLKLRKAAGAWFLEPSPRAG